jgi:predicted small lipoprotein YifL
MKLYKYNLLTIIILTLVIAGCGDKPADKAAKETGKQSSVTGFRNSQWGTTLDEVKKNEKIAFTRGDTASLVFTGDVYGKKADVFYFFDESGSLFSGAIRFDIEGKSLEEVVKIYGEIKSQMIKELGAASVDAVILTDSSITEDTKSATAGILSGNKIFTADWNDNPGTQTGIILSKLPESPLNLGVVYQRK